MLVIGRDATIADFHDSVLLMATTGYLMSFFPDAVRIGTSWPSLALVISTFVPLQTPPWKGQESATTPSIISHSRKFWP